MGSSLLPEDHGGDCDDIDDDDGGGDASDGESVIIVVVSRVDKAILDSTWQCQDLATLWKT